MGRPLSDLAALSSDDALETDARAVLAGAGPQGREVMSESGSWHMRCVQPYRTEEGRTEGVVITFVDITERREAAAALEAARRVAERADAAKSRFLAAASHDLRQPLQSLTLIHGLLARPEADRARLGALLDRTLASMTGMLDTLLDVNRIEAGELRPYITTVAVGPLLARLAEEFAALAAEKGLRLRLRPCSLSVRSDGRLLEQMLRNLLSNALKYTKKGGVLLGWRRRSGRLRIEVWDTGLGVPADETEAIFDAYHQVAQTSAQGLGLGLSIVRSLGEKLGHGVGVRSRPGRGSVFWIDAALAQADAATMADPAAPAALDDRPLGAILLVEDDPDLCELLADMLTAAGHKVAVAADAAEARRLAEDLAAPPDLLLTDYDLRSGTTGLELAEALGAARGAPLPTIILSGDITTSALSAIAASSCLRLAKPATPETLTSAVASMLREARTGGSPEAQRGPGQPTIHVVDDDPAMRAASRRLFEAEGWFVRDHASGESFLAAPRPTGDACLVIDVGLPGMDGLGVLAALGADGSRTPAIVVTGHGDAATAIAAMRAGAVDFIEKPAPGPELVASVARALDRARDARAREAWRAHAAARFENLTPREREVLAKVLAGAPNKNIAADLGISQRTVENHRAAVMRKTGAATLPELVRLSLAAARTD